jgi:hypothetical protein
MARPATPRTGQQWGDVDAKCSQEHQRSRAKQQDNQDPLDDVDEGDQLLPSRCADTFQRLNPCQSAPARNVHGNQAQGCQNYD